MTFAFTPELALFLVEVCIFYAMLIADYRAFTNLDIARRCALETWQLLSLRHRQYQEGDDVEPYFKLSRASGPLRYQKHREAAEAAHEWGRWALLAPPWINRLERWSRVLSPMFYPSLILACSIPIHWYITPDPSLFVIFYPMFITSMVVMAKGRSVYVTKQATRAAQAYDHDLKLLLEGLPPLDDSQQPPVSPDTKSARDSGPRWSIPRTD